MLNSHLVPTAAFQSQPNLVLSGRKQVDAVEAVVGADLTMPLNAHRLAQKLLGNTLGANMILVGFALQQDLLPVSLAAVERAIELNGIAVDFNKKALLIGRLAAADPDLLAQLTPSILPDRSEARQTSLAGVRQVRAEFLKAYQSSRLALRYEQFVDQVARRESEVAGDSTELTHAVARYYFKLLAYKDEYEVARLHSDGRLKQALDDTFEGSYEIQFSLAPPLLSRIDKRSGEPQKRTYGAWVLKLFGLLATMKFLRGSILDPFGYTAERKMERQLIVEYEALIADVLDRLERHNLPKAVELASLPEEIRGYGPIKHRNVQQVRDQQTQLLAEFGAPKASRAA